MRAKAGDKLEIVVPWEGRAPVMWVSLCLNILVVLLKAKQTKIAKLNSMAIICLPIFF